jgi:hypothetical protein
MGGLRFRLVLRGLAPLLVMIGPIVLSVVFHMTSYCLASYGYVQYEIPRIAGARKGNSTKPFREGFNAVMLRALPYVIFISFCLVQSVSAGVFSAWDCVEFIVDSTSTPEVTKEFLREDMSIECETDEHWKIKRVAYVFFALWPVGMPLLYLLMLVPCREVLLLPSDDERRKTPLIIATSFLHGEYVPELFWWEVCYWRPAIQFGTLLSEPLLC